MDKQTGGRAGSIEKMLRENIAALERRCQKMEARLKERDAVIELIAKGHVASEEMKRYQHLMDDDVPF